MKYRKRLRISTSTSSRGELADQVKDLPGLAARGAESARGGPRVPAQGWRLHPGRHRHLHRLQARARGRPGGPAPAPLRVLPLLRRLIGARPGTPQACPGRRPPGRRAVRERPGVAEAVSAKRPAEWSARAVPGTTRPPAPDAPGSVRSPGGG